MVRRVDCAGCEVHIKGLVGRHRLLRLHPANRLIGHVVGKVIARDVGRIYASHTIVNQRVPLIGLAPNKAIKLVEA